jgi:hypothetical protein
MSWPLDSNPQSAGRLFSKTMLCKETPKLAAMPIQVSPALILYVNGVGEGIGVSVGVGVWGVGVRVGVEVWVGVTVGVGSTTRPVLRSRINTRAAPRLRITVSIINAIGRLKVIWGIRLP